jgi:hypothetical protein
LPVLVSLIGATVLALSGCATTAGATGETTGAAPIGDDAGHAAAALPAADRAFIEESLTLFTARSTGRGESQRGISGQDEIASHSREASQPATIDRGTTLLGQRFSVGSVVGFVSFSAWDAGRDLLRETEVLEDAGIERLRRVVFVAEGGRIVLFLDVASRPFPVAWSLFRSPWKREGRGVWRDPATGATLELRRNASWIYTSEGTPREGGGSAADAGTHAATHAAADAGTHAQAHAATPAATTLDAVAWRTADLLHRTLAADAPERSIGALLWFRDIEVQGLPAGLLPASATVALFDIPSSEADGDTVSGGPLHAAVSLPFADDRAARTASVAVRLLLPSVLDGTGVEIDVRSGIVRDDEILILKDVAVGRPLVDAITRRLAP